MKRLLLIFTVTIWALSINAGSPTTSEPVKTEKTVVPFMKNKVGHERHRSPALNGADYYAYYEDGILSLDILTNVSADTHCIITICGIEIIATAAELNQGVYIGVYEGVEIEIFIPYIGTLVGTL